MMLAPTNKAAETAAAIAAENECCRLCDMAYPFLRSIGLGNDRDSVADCRTDTGAHKYGGGENGCYGGGDAAGNVREHGDFLSILNCCSRYCEDAQYSA